MERWFVRWPLIGVEVLAFGWALFLLVPSPVSHVDYEPDSMATWFQPPLAFGFSRIAALLARTDQPVSAFLKFAIFTLAAYVMADVKSAIPHWS
jgi:hypothetical protein